MMDEVKPKAAVKMDPQKEEQILDCALHNFAKYGYRDTKTEVIALEAHVSKGTVFHYFGSKDQLLIIVVENAIKKITQVSDFSVWTESKDLVDMVIRATKYKIELELKYADEFRLLMNVYGAIDQFPKRIQPILQETYQREMQDQIGELLNPVLAKMDLRDDVTPALVFELVTAIMSQIEQQTTVLMHQDPNAKLKDFTEIIDKATRYLEVVERGIVRKSAV